MQLLKYALLSVVLVAAWFVLATLPQNMFMKVALGWIGLLGIALYWRFLLRKFRNPKSEN
jgi:hypothetical protein